MPDSNYTITREYLVRWALRRIGEANPTTDEILFATGTLNALLKKIDVSGQWFWSVSNTPSTLSIVAGQKSYTVATPPAGLVSDALRLNNNGVYLDKGSDQRTYLRVIDKQEFLGSSEHESTGEPYLVYLERKPDLADNVLWILPTPAGTETLKYHYQRRLYDFDAATDNPDFPQEWMEPLSILLADAMTDEYQIPLQERQWLQAKAQMVMKEMKLFGAEHTDSTTLATEYF